SRRSSGRRSCRRRRASSSPSFARRSCVASTLPERWRSEQVVERQADADRRLPPVVVDQALAVAAEHLQVALERPEQRRRRQLELGGTLAGPCVVAPRARDAYPESER